MWNEILGALSILAMIMAGVILLPGSPKLVDAVCDRIRYGVQNLYDEDQEQDETPATPLPAATTKPVAAPTGKTVPATKTTTPRAAA